MPYGHPCEGYRRQRHTPEIRCSRWVMATVRIDTGSLERRLRVAPGKIKRVARNALNDTAKELRGQTHRSTGNPRAPSSCARTAC